MYPKNSARAIQQATQWKDKVKTKVFEQTRRFWERLVEFVGIPDHLKWAQLTKDKEGSLIKNSHQVATASKVRPPTKTSSSPAEGSAQRDRFQNHGESSRARATLCR